MHMDTTALLARFAARDITVAVIGLGYVGLPLCVACAAAGIRVVGFDIDPAKPRALLAGETYLSSIPAERVAGLVDSGRFDATTDFARLAEADAIIICVPTPLTQHREPDLSYVTATAETIARTLRPGQLVVLESTTWRGPRQRRCAPILDVTGLICGEEYFLAFSPEREDPGNSDFGASNTPKVVGADDTVARDLACALYSAVTQRVVPVSSTRAAEAVKLTENIFRAVNIAMVNEMKVVYAAMGIDIWEVVDAAKTKPFGYMPFYPGPGAGRPLYPDRPVLPDLEGPRVRNSDALHRAGGRDQHGPCRAMSSSKPRKRSTGAWGRGLNGARVLLLGLAYKKNVNDMRESPAIKLIELFKARGAHVDYADPHVPDVPPSREHPDLTGMQAVSPATVADYDAAVIVTDHDAFDYAAIVAGAKLVVDTRNACGSRGLSAGNIVKA